MPETTENNELILETGELEDARMILGDSTRIFYSGIVRAGAKIPKNNCTPAEKEKFKKLESEGLPYDEIDKQLGGTPRSSKSKLFPTNVDYFIIRDCDFKDPGDAQFIRDNFSDLDGKVRRIPIWLATGDISVAVPHNHKAFDGGSNVRAFSYYDGDDHLLKYVPKNVGPQPQKGDWVTIPFDNPDAKLPDDAPAGIKFGGLYKVNVKGIKGAGEIMVPTHSWYGISNSIAVLRRVRTVLGRFSGLLCGEPFLMLEKVQETVRDPDGKRQKQWITTINAAVDMADLATYAESRPTRGVVALNQFNGTIAPSSAKPASTSAVKYAPASTPAAQPEQSSSSVPSKQTPKKEQGRSASSGTASTPPAEKADQKQAAVESPSAITERQKVIDILYNMAKNYGLTEMELEAYANFKLRQPLNQEKDTERLRKLKTELEMRLDADRNAVKMRCQDLLKVTAEQLSSSADPEVEGMLNEFVRLAENNDVPKLHLLAHLAVLYGTVPGNMTLQQLQTAYAEVDARIKRCGGKLDELKKEFAENYREVSKAA